MHYQGLALVAAGIFTGVAASMDWDWFMNNYRARLFVSLFGRNGARVFYGALGGVLVLIGMFVTFGAVK